MRPLEVEATNSIFYLPSFFFVFHRINISVFKKKKILHFHEFICYKKLMYSDGQKKIRDLGDERNVPHCSKTVKELYMGKAMKKDI